MHTPVPTLGGQGWRELLSQPPHPVAETAMSPTAAAAVAHVMRGTNESESAILVRVERKDIESSRGATPVISRRVPSGARRKARLNLRRNGGKTPDL
jgi:hypothetical protein